MDRGHRSPRVLTAVAVLAARQHRLTAAQQRLEQQAQTLAAYTQVQLALAAWQPQVRP